MRLRNQSQNLGLVPGIEIYLDVYSANHRSDCSGHCRRLIRAASQRREISDLSEALKSLKLSEKYVQIRGLALPFDSRQSLIRPDRSVLKLPRFLPGWRCALPNEGALPLAARRLPSVRLRHLIRCLASVIELSCNESLQRYYGV